MALSWNKHILTLDCVLLWIEHLNLYVSYNSENWIMNEIQKYPTESSINQHRTHTDIHVQTHLTLHHLRSKDAPNNRRFIFFFIIISRFNCAVLKIYRLCLFFDLKWKKKHVAMNHSSRTIVHIAIERVRERERNGLLLSWLFVCY